MIRLDNERRLKIPNDLIKISNLKPNEQDLFIILKGNEILITAEKDKCFDGILACVHLDVHNRFVIPSRVIKLLHLKAKSPFIIYVNDLGYIGLKVNTINEQ